MNALQTFVYGERQPVRVSLIDGEHWFVARDVCDVLGIGNSRQALAKLDTDEKGVILNDTLGGSQKVSTVSESGLYTLIMRSDKPAARAFRRWVTHEVLPALRQKGFYGKSEGTEILASLAKTMEGFAGLVERQVSALEGIAQRVAALESGRHEREGLFLPPLALLPSRGSRKLIASPLKFWRAFLEAVTSGLISANSYEISIVARDPVSGIVHRAVGSVPEAFLAVILYPALIRPLGVQPSSARSILRKTAPWHAPKAYGGTGSHRFSVAGGLRFTAWIFDYAKLAQEIPDVSTLR